MLVQIFYIPYITFFLIEGDIIFITFYILFALFTSTVIANDINSGNDFIYFILFCVDMRNLFEKTEIMN